MAKTHRVLRRISGVEHLTPGDIVDVSGWKNLDKLVDQRYLEKLTEAEIAAQEAVEAAKVEKSQPPQSHVQPTTPEVAAAKPATKPAAKPAAAHKPV